MKIPISLLLLLLVLVIIAGCGSSPGPDSISSHTSTAAGAIPDCLACHSPAHPLLDPLLTNGEGQHGKHIAHVTNLAITCTRCHFQYTDHPTHMNGTLDTPNPDVLIVYFDSTNSAGQWGQQAGSCTSLYCHSNGTGGTSNVAPSGNPPLYDPRTVVSSTSPAWNSTAVLSCTTCHGFPPSYVEDQFRKSNSHMSADHAKTCDVCHYATTHDGSTIFDVTKHDNGIYDVAPNPTVNFVYTYDPGGGRCDNVSCHPGESNSNTWGNVHPNRPIGQTNGPGCYEVRLGVAGLEGSCIWVFGDGTGSTDCVPPGHIYPSNGPFAVTVTGRNENWHPFTSVATVNPAPVNVLPTASAVASVFNYTVTLTVTASDPDYNSCGHSGNDGSIAVTWGGYVDTQPEVSLTNTPSNTVFTRTFDPVSAMPSNVPVTVTDNAGGTVVTGVPLTVPALYSVSGTVTHGYPATGLSGVSMYLKLASTDETKAIATTVEDGTYSFPNNLPGTYKVIPLKSGETFSPPEQQFTVGPDATGVGFTATP